MRWDDNYENAADPLPGTWEECREMFPRITYRAKVHFFFISCEKSGFMSRGPNFLLGYFGRRRVHEEGCSCWQTQNPHRHQRSDIDAKSLQGPEPALQGVDYASSP